MIKITDILNYPDGTPIDAIQGRISEVYAYEKKTGAKGPYTLQKAYISDVGGNKIRLTVWDHPDLAPLKGNEYVLHNTGGTRFPGIKVRLGSYVAQKDGQTHKAGDTVKTLELNVTKNGCFQHIEVYNQSKPADKPAAEPVSKPATGQTVQDPNKATSQVYINGASVGMAVNNAIQVLMHNGPIDPATFKTRIWNIASEILEVSQHIEKGNLSEKTVGANPALNSAQVYQASLKNASPAPAPELTEDVPY